MKATYNKNAKTKFTTFHRKETKCYFDSYTALVPGLDRDGNAILSPVVELRLYGTGNTNSAALWVHDSKSNIYTSGTGCAGGYGYDRPSEAAGIAIKNAGFTISENIGGRGATAIESAIKAIAECIGYPNCAVFHSHQ